MAICIRMAVSSVGFSKILYTLERLQFNSWANQDTERPWVCNSFLISWPICIITPLHWLKISPIQPFIYNKVWNYKKETWGNQSPAYPTTQAFALPFKEDKQRQLAHAIVIYRYRRTNKPESLFTLHGRYINTPRGRLCCSYLPLIEFAKFGSKRLTHKNALLCKTPHLARGLTGARQK